MGHPKHYELTSYLHHTAQDPYEISKLAEVLVEVDAKSFLEIGSRSGSSLWYLANVLPRGSRVVSIDSGVGMGGGNPGQLESLKECVKELSKSGYDVHFFYGKSSDAKIIAAVKALGPYDAVFIDADHTYAGVKFDWKIYSEMATRIVSLHDVAFKWNPTMKFSPDEIGVPKLWRKIVAWHSNTKTFVGDEAHNKGIGVVWK